jgi:hypothetical protein
MNADMFNHAYMLYMQGYISEREMNYMLEEAGDYAEYDYECF